MAQRLSQLASELWPFLLPKVGAMVQGAGGGGGVSGGSVGLHDLSGSLHKGTLATLTPTMPSCTASSTRRITVSPAHSIRLWD